MSHNEKCKFCEIIFRIPYTKEIKEKPWKRRVLFLISLLMTIAGSYSVFLAFIDYQPLNFIPLKGIGIFFSFLGALGLVVSAFGCNKCVAKILGEF